MASTVFDNCSNCSRDTASDGGASRDDARRRSSRAPGSRLEERFRLHDDDRSRAAEATGGPRVLVTAERLASLLSSNVAQHLLLAAAR